MSSSIKPPFFYKTALVMMAAGKLALWPKAAAPIFSSWKPAAFLGVPVFLAGALFASGAKKTFKQTSTPMMGGPSTTSSPLHMSGVFAKTRNPMYLGISVALAGAALAMNCAWHLAYPILNILIMDRYYIPIEETQLQHKFGEDYVKYKRQVRRWI